MNEERITLPTDLMKKLHNAQRRLTQLITECDKAESCGISMAKFREMIAENLDVLQKLDNQFGHGSLTQMRQ